MNSEEIFRRIVGALESAGILLACTALPLAATETCTLRFDVCPDNFFGGTLTVPSKVSAFDPFVPVCDIPFSLTAPAGAISVMVLLENSTAMDTIDPKGYRFELASKLLTMVRQVAPASEAGIVAFSHRLSFDHRDNPFLQTAFPEDDSQHDSFIPLTRVITEFPEGRTGLDTLLAFLKHDSAGNLSSGTAQPATRTNPIHPNTSIRGGSDLGLALQTAKLAMKSARYGKRDQYIFLITQGIVQGVDTHRLPLADAFYAAAYSDSATPTTFTFYIPGDSSQLGNIHPLTDNIRWNRYSTSNPLSNYWKADLMAEESRIAVLKSLLVREKRGNIPNVPRRMEVVISGAGMTFGSISGKTAKLIDNPQSLQWKDSMRVRFTTIFEDSTGDIAMDLSGILSIRRTTGPVSPRAGITVVCPSDTNSTVIAPWASRRPGLPTPGRSMEAARPRYDAAGRHVQSICKSLIGMEDPRREVPSGGTDRVPDHSEAPGR